jgi:hypothetical protein
MTAYYNKEKDMICIRELYSDSCDINDDANSFFMSIRKILRDLTNDTSNELKLVTFMCDHKIIFPSEFLYVKDSQYDNLLNNIVNLGYTKDVAITLISKLTDLASEPVEQLKLIDSDPRTNGSQKPR